MDAEQDAYARIYYDRKFRAIVKRMQLYPPMIKKKAFKVEGNFKGTFYDYILARFLQFTWEIFSLYLEV